MRNNEQVEQVELKKGNVIVYAQKINLNVFFLKIAHLKSFVVSCLVLFFR